MYIRQRVPRDMERRVAEIIASELDTSIDDPEEGPVGFLMRVVEHLTDRVKELERKMDQLL